MSPLTAIENLYREYAPLAFQPNEKMSPFSQFGSLPGVGGYGGGIDRDFSPILNYIDEFDRHFSRRHRFMNCFIPRFDLEEDAHNYYLYGEIPGATIDTITIEAHSNHTLQIYGKTIRVGPALLSSQPQEGSDGGGEFVKVQVEDHEHSTAEHKEHVEPPTSAPTQQAVASTFPPPPTQGQQLGHPHHERHHTFGGGLDNGNPSQRHILLSERLVGDFHRTFAFPSPVVEDGVRASLENGVLSLVVPKKDGGSEERRGRRVPIMQGGGRN
ncbi:HSP20-like chaperone [Mollisia scopiformis]|uniref:HSP20-like chaperone n=1 Tax=Mollisia scopiformis TaxID=149040 RepID=A0A194X625_MOLSC|nr:HSP20-like chaperone [Mollisia scopiformis]KUJ15257.1 HSP20-like chaperone [Mollisia scopiformis]